MIISSENCNAEVRKLRTQLASTQRQLKVTGDKYLLALTAIKNSAAHHKKMLTDALNMQEQLRHLSRRILLAQEEERKQISRELHDEVTQVLTGIKIRLATLTQETSVTSSTIKKKIAGAQKMVGESVDIVHRFARELRPTLLDDLGLIPALHAYMKTLTQRTGLKIRFTAFAGIEKLNNLKRTTLYRVAQSALNNVAQHSMAGGASVTITKVTGKIIMEIKDDGIAFDAERALRAVRPRRLGLLSMRERVEMVGGVFSVVSVPSKGTTIIVHIPFADTGK